MPPPVATTALAAATEPSGSFTSGDFKDAQPAAAAAALALALAAAAAAAAAALAAAASCGSHWPWLCAGPVQWALRAKQWVRWRGLLRQRGLHYHQPAPGSNLGYVL